MYRRKFRLQEYHGDCLTTDGCSKPPAVVQRVARRLPTTALFAPREFKCDAEVCDLANKNPCTLQRWGKGGAGGLHMNLEPIVQYHPTPTKMVSYVRSMYGSYSVR